MKEYYILSISHQDPNCLVWWKEKCSGYTCQLDKAGKYTEEEIKGRKEYFDNYKETKAIPCNDVDNVAIKIVENKCDILEKLGIEY